MLSTEDSILHNVTQCSILINDLQSIMQFIMNGVEMLSTEDNILHNVTCSVLMNDFNQFCSS